jgi:EAL and modified HD-GYP domain-containing signal transduction protein
MPPFLHRVFAWFFKLSDQIPAERGEASANADDLALLDSEVPLQSADDKQHSFVRREAILDRTEKIVAYEFSLLTTLQARLHQRSGIAKRAYDGALLTRLALHGVTSLLGNRLAFVSLSAESLDNALIDRLPPQNTVLILEITQPVTDWEGIAARLAELKHKGLCAGLRIHDIADTTCPLIGGLDFIQIDVPTFNGIDLQSLTSDLRKKHAVGTLPPRLVAHDVQSHDDFQFCDKCGFDLFQGPFITGGERLHPTSGGVNRMAVLPILNMVRSDQSFALIAGQLKNEPTLTYKLLRYLNSPAMGLQQPIDSLTEALVLIGREKFYRWMSLLLFDFANPSYRERSLAERALVRGHTLELLAGKGRIPNAKDHLFLIGLFSLLDVTLGRPLPELLEQATLPDAVRDALLGKAGAYADALALAVLGEADATTLPEQMAQALERCGIGDGQLTSAAAEALVWANLALGETT